MVAHEDRPRQVINRFPHLLQR